MIADDAPTAVLDTNVVLDWLVFHDASVAPLVAAVESGALRWLASARMRAELAHVIGRAELVGWDFQAERVLAMVDRHAQFCDEPGSSLLVCSDPDDQVFIDLALGRRSRWLFTRDKALLRLARGAERFGTTVCQPQVWLTP